jgi:hypothetical protein
MTEHSSGALPTPKRRIWIEAALTFAAIAGVLSFYWESVDWHGGFLPHSDGYRLLVRGYLKGQLHLDAEPDPRLAALADPYDPVQNAPYRLADVSYFNNRYYLYFGSVPAVVLMAPYELVMRRDLPTGAATFVFASLGFLAACGVWLGLRARWFPRSGAWMAPLGVLVLGFSTHVLALVRRPDMWELAIAAGFAFTMLALFAVQRALVGRRPLQALLAAGVCVGLAVGSRPTCLFAAAMLLPPIWLAWRRPRAGAEWWRCALAAAAGLVVCGVAICVHNYARFGNPFEMGQHYQLSMTKVSTMRLYRLAYVAHNIGVYFFNLPGWTWNFPFVAATTDNSDIPGYFCTEEIVGIGVSLPLLWLGLFAPLAARIQGRPRGESAVLSLQIWSFAATFLPMVSFLLLFCAATERYMADFTPALGLLALGGALAVERWAQRGGWKRVALPVLFALGAVTVAMGALVSFDYHGRMLSRAQPERWPRWERTAQESLERIGVWTGQFTGPRVHKVHFKQQPIGTVETYWQSNDTAVAERILVEHQNDHQVRFGYVRGAAPARWGRPVKWEIEQTHTVELQLPSLYRAPHGIMRGLRSAEEFRERSCVVIWFSGTRALAEIVEPLGPGGVAGGRIGDNFSGTARHSRVRCFRSDEFPVSDSLTDPRGGTMRLRVMLPLTLAPEGEPLLALGVIYGSDVVFVRDAGAGATKFVFEHFGGATHESAPVQLARGQVHTIEITLPSSVSGSTFGNAATGEVRVRVNGSDVLRVTSECHSFRPSSEAVGSNPFGTTCARLFSGWLLEARWMSGMDP